MFSLECPAGLMVGRVSAVGRVLLHGEGRSVLWDRIWGFFHLEVEKMYIDSSA